MWTALWKLTVSGQGEALPGLLLAGLVLAVAICTVAALLLRLIPQDEAALPIYRNLRLGIILTATLLTFAVMAVAVVLYFAIALSGALPAPI